MKYVLKVVPKPSIPNTPQLFWQINQTIRDMLEKALTGHPYSVIRSVVTNQGAHFSHCPVTLLPSAYVVA